MSEKSKNSNFILGIKKKMTQIFVDSGEAIPVTVVAAGPCRVVQVKNKTNDGYLAVQLGYGKKNKLTKALQGHLKALENYKYLREFYIDDELADKISRGQEIKVDTFTVGEKVKVVGLSKGKGFQGVVKRHGFAGSPASHGHKDQLRMPGSIGATDAARVFKGTRMAGRMGGQQVTVANLVVVKVDPEDNLLYLKGAVPGPRGGLLKILGQGELKLAQPDKPAADKSTTSPDKPAADKAGSSDKQDDVKVSDSSQPDKAGDSQVDDNKKINEQKNQEENKDQEVKPENK